MRNDRRPLDPPEEEVSIEAVRASEHDTLRFESGSLSTGTPMVTVVVKAYRGTQSLSFPAEHAAWVALSVLRAARWPDDSYAVQSLVTEAARVAPLIQRRNELAEEAGYSTYSACPTGYTKLIDKHIELENSK